MIEVHDGITVYQFDGEEIAFSSSERPDVDRWIEFTLYKTQGDGQYVLSRVGVSNIYHSPDCRVAVQGKIDPAPWSELDPEAVGCRECEPDRNEPPMVCPERDKTWGRVYKTPQELYNGLMKPDKATGALYMTAVARKLLEQAAQRDPSVKSLSLVQKVT